MTLEDKYGKLSNSELIKIIEYPDAYREEAINTAKLILKKRNILPAAFKQLARDFWLSYSKEHLRGIISAKQKLESQFLNESEMKEVIQAAYEYHRERQELFEIDIEKYWGFAI